MLFEDFGGNKTSFAKDPCIIRFQGRYYLYYTKHDSATDLYGVGIAVSDDLTHYDIVGVLRSELPGEGAGICAPAAIVLNGAIHLFYQSYGQFPKDYICHAVSTDGVNFTRDASNPIFKPQGDWNCGRAIDADVIAFNGKLFLYFASRDPEMKIQLLGVATAPLDSDFSRDTWTQQSIEESILYPLLPWEQQCIEAPATCVHDGKVYMFYAGAYNCCPQQIGCAVSEDGVYFTRLFSEPFMTNGPKGSWNESESGHPYAYEDEGVYHLFYQGSDDKGKTWRLSRVQVDFDKDGMPFIVK